MDWHDPRAQRSPFARQAAQLDIIVSYGYVAPVRLALDETRRATAAAAAQQRLLADARLSDGTADMGAGRMGVRAGFARFGRFLRRAMPPRSSVIVAHR